MDNEDLVKNWHNKIVAICEKKLERRLSDPELKFVASRGGFMALEMIEDTVSSITGDELASYLNSES